MEVKSSRLTPAMIGLLAVLIALVAVFTRVAVVPTGASGYANLSDVAITFVSLTFGPWVGAIAGGVGTALADLTTPFAQYAPVSLIVHGLQGLVIGLIGGHSKDVRRMILAWLAGAVIMVGGYLLGSTIYYGLPVALTEVLPNTIQAVVGGLVGIPLVFAVRRAYPAVDRLGQRQTWTE